MDDNAEDCPVCLTPFDDIIQRPRTLPCGHTLCTPCINGLEGQGLVMCPTCRVAHTVPEAGQFPISYAFEALIRRLRVGASSCQPPRPRKDTTEPAPSPVTEPSQKGPAGLGRAILSMLQEHEAKVVAAIHTCQEVQVQLDHYRTTLVDWGERQQILEDRLQALVNQSKDARVLVKQEESKVVTKKEQVQQGEQQLHAVLQTLRTLTTEQEVGTACVDAVRCTDEEGQRVEECQGMFPDVHTVTTINKVREASSAALEAANTVQAAMETVGAPAGAEGEPDPMTAQDSSITDRFKALLTPNMKTLQAKDLRSLTKFARSLLQDGLVFTVHQQEGWSRHGKVTCEDDHLYFHSLQDQLKPQRAVTVQVDEVLPATPPCLVFLDLAWPGSAPRRVHIRLRPDTPRGRQFLMLCTGQRGPCYLNTRLFKVWEKWMWVYGGDYEHNNGRGGAGLLPHLDECAIEVSPKAGDVIGYGHDSTRGAWFIIITMDSDVLRVSGVFGKVVDGLEVVAAAAQHRPITEVVVVDCGVVLWQ